MLKALQVTESIGQNRLPGLNKNRIKKLLAGDISRTPLLILSRSMIRKNLGSLSRALPGVKIHYAVKSNDHQAILEEIAKSGHSFDIASYMELQQVSQTGAKPGDIIHSHPIKSPQEISDAINSGVSLFAVDNPDEIEKFKEYAGRVRLLIRFKIDGGSAVVNLSYKFGCLPEEVLPLARKIKQYGIDYHGLAFHVGSQCEDSSIHVQAIEMASRLINQLDDLGFKSQLLDIGGGFPTCYLTNLPPISVYCRPIREALKKHILPDIEIACEPGRFISGSAVTLAASVIGKSVRSGKAWYFLDDGLYGSFSGRLYDHCRYQVLTSRNTTWKRSVLAGPTCDSFDVIYKDILLPPLDIGDVLLFPAMGSYCSVSASSFNSLKKAEYVVIE